MDNYRSTQHIIAAANAVIAQAPQRMKTAHPIHIDRARSKQAPGGAWQVRDPVGQGRVQVLPVPGDAVAQAVALMQELLRLASLDAHWDWHRCAVIARNWSWLQPLRAFCELHHIPVQLADEEGVSLWQLRETQALLDWLRQRTPALVEPAQMQEWISAQAKPNPQGPATTPNHETVRPELVKGHLYQEGASTHRQAQDRSSSARTVYHLNPEGVRHVQPADLLSLPAGAGRREGAVTPANTWWVLLHEAVDVYALETSVDALPVQHFVDWLAEWGRDIRRKQTGLLLLSAHRAKGLEFDHVAVLDGGWFNAPGDHSALAQQAEQRLYYVAMTRARQTLTLCRMNAGQFLPKTFSDSPAVLWRDAIVPAALAPELYWQYHSATLKEVDMGFAGRSAASHAIHQHIAALSPGDLLALVQHEQKWLLHDAQGRTIGRMAGSFGLPAGRVCQSVSVRAILQRRRDQTDAEFQHLCRVDQWELVLPELILV